MPEVFTPAPDMEAFYRSMDNAFRRASGNIGFAVSRDRGNTNALKERAGRALESGMDYSLGPMFLRLGKSAVDISGYRPSGEVDIKTCAGDILREFFEEGTASFAAVQNGLTADALNALRTAGFSEAQSEAVLSSAQSAFLMPDKEEFTAAALAFFPKGPSVLMKATLAGAAAFAPSIVLLRNPVLAGILGTCAAGAAYYFMRAGQRAAVERMLGILPKQLYDMLDTKLQSGVRRFAEAVNSALAKA